MVVFDPNDLNTYTVKQLRSLNTENDLGIGRTATMTKKELIENIKITNWWVNKSTNLKGSQDQSKNKGGDSSPSVNEVKIDPNLSTNLKGSQPRSPPIVLKPIVLDPVPPQPQPQPPPPPQVPKEEPAWPAPVQEKVTTTVTKDDDGNTVIVLVIKNKSKLK